WFSESNAAVLSFRNRRSTDIKTGGALAPTVGVDDLRDVFSDIYLWDFLGILSAVGFALGFVHWQSKSGKSGSISCCVKLDNYDCAILVLTRLEPDGAAQIQKTMKKWKQLTAQGAMRPGPWLVFECE